MATKSRTYLPTDWQLWTYTPVAGKFRLDFSVLDGADVLGGVSDTGTIQVLDIAINSISLEDGQRPDQSIFSSFQPGTMALSAQLLEWDNNLVQELYNGKQVFLTLKNEATNSEPTFGKNTIFFIGNIENLEIDVDPINQVTNLVISANDISSSVMNLPLSFTKTNIGKNTDIQGAFSLAQARGFINSYLSLGIYSGLASSYETTGTIVSAFSDIMDDFISSEVAIYAPFYQQIYSGSYTLKRLMCAATVDVTPTTGEREWQIHY